MRRRPAVTDLAAAVTRPPPVGPPPAPLAGSDEGMGADELAHCAVVAQVAPVEDAAERAEPVRVVTPEAGCDVDRLLVGGNRCCGVNVVPPSCTLVAGACQQVAVPVGLRPQAAQMNMPSKLR
ncbi:hypothetical protein GCM10027451_19730 [Geodermatophilus aquaeductus]